MHDELRDDDNHIFSNLEVEEGWRRRTKINESYNLNAKIFKRTKLLKCMLSEQAEPDPDRLNKPEPDRY